jgi:hypothetical protein
MPRELPSSVIPVPLQEKFLSVIKLNRMASFESSLHILQKGERQMEILLEILSELPQHEYTLLKLLCLTNHQIALNHEQVRCIA